MFFQENDKVLFNELLYRLELNHNNPDFELLLEYIVGMYSRSNRYYHSFRHIRQSLFVLEKFKKEAKDLGSLTLAIWFHDIEQGFAHEQNSVDVMNIFLEPHRNSIRGRLIKKASELILDTRHPGNPQTNDGKLIHDIDLYGFSRGIKQGLRDSLAIRKEYSDVSNKNFFSNRKIFLENLLAAGPIFKHQSFFYLEKKAQKNIKELIDFCVLSLESLLLWR